MKAIEELQEVSLGPINRYTLEGSEGNYRDENDIFGLKMKFGTFNNPYQLLNCLAIPSNRVLRNMECCVLQVQPNLFANKKTNMYEN